MMKKSNSNQPARQKYRYWYIGILVLLLVIALSYLYLPLTNPDNSKQHLAQITVYKSPTCGCCNKWIEHLKENGFEVKAYNRTDMSSIKRDKGIKSQHQSCHTAMIDGYFIEGHVPANDIKQLLKEKPDAAGLTAPGMPMGSPGMEGHRKDSYSVLLIDKNGSTEVYDQY